MMNNLAFGQSTSEMVLRKHAMEQLTRLPFLNVDISTLKDGSSTERTDFQSVRTGVSQTFQSSIMQPAESLTKIRPLASLVCAYIWTMLFAYRFDKVGVAITSNAHPMHVTQSSMLRCRFPLLGTSVNHASMHNSIVTQGRSICKRLLNALEHDPTFKAKRRK